MKKKTRKVHRNFKIELAVNSLLEREAIKTNRTQTAIVELALRKFFGMIA